MTIPPHPWYFGGRQNPRSEGKARVGPGPQPDAKPYAHPDSFPDTIPTSPEAIARPPENPTRTRAAPVYIVTKIERRSDRPPIARPSPIQNAGAPHYLACAPALYCVSFDAGTPALRFGA
jgi:hypothetical protein